MKWNQEALNESEKTPRFASEMAKKAVEKDVKAQGRDEVTLEDVRKGRDKYIAFAEGDDKPGKEKIAVVRCETVAEVCPGVACFKAFNKKKIHFRKYPEDTEMIGFITCGGCPGRRVSRLVDSLIKHGLTTVHLSSCMLSGGDFPLCPHVEEIKKSIAAKGIKVVDGTHH